MTLELSSSGPSALAQSDKMGTYHLFGYVNQRPAYQHSSGLDYLYYADGDAWVIGKYFWDTSPKVKFSYWLKMY